MCCSRYKSFLALPLSVLIGGCASLSGWETQTAPDNFVEDTLILGEVIVITTREQALSNDGLFEGWREKLVSAGYSDSDIADGSEVSIWTYCYAHNSGVPMCTHSGHYIAHVPLGLRKQLRGHPPNPQDAHGDLVEVKLTETEGGYLVGEVVAIYREAGDWCHCREAYLKYPGAVYSVLSTLMLVGPPQGMWIECDMKEGEGWQRRPVRGAPLSDGPPVSEWVKFPR
jgi:hypothetical protein